MKILIFGGDSDIAKEIQRVEKNAILIPRKVCDIRKPDAVAKILNTYKPEIVINCAGIFKSANMKEESSTDLSDQIMINLIGSFFVALAAVKQHIKTIILLGSAAGLYGKANVSAYSASKAGVISLVQSLGMEGINAYCISPGGVDTKMREAIYPNEDTKTRLSTQDVVKVVFDCINKKYKPGDNIVIRKQNLKKIIKIDKGQPWKAYLHI